MSKSIAAMGCAQLENIDKYVASKRKVAAEYEEFFKNVHDIEFFVDSPNTVSNYWLNAVILKDKDAQIDFLTQTNDNGVMTRPIWELMNRLPMFENCENDGYGTSVTPVSQFYFQQAFNNVMFGNWSKIAEGYGKMVLGYFGKTPCEPDEEVKKIASEQLGLEPTTEKVVDLNDKDPSKGIEAATKRLVDAGLEVNDENIFISAACKDKGIMFLQGHGVIGVRKNEAKKEASTVAGGNEYTVKVNGKNYAVKLDGDKKATVNGKAYDIAVSEGISAAPAASGDGKPVEAPLPGNILRICVSEGDSVAEGDVILVVEAMKMETEIKAPEAGTVQSILVAQGDKVQTGQTLVTLG